jgi:hypothetical protein
MSAVEPARERIARQLQDAVERVRQDMEQVEFWTEVLGCLSRPVPDYGAGTNVLDRFALPPRGSDDTARIGQRGGDLGPHRSEEEAKIVRPDKRPNTGRAGH